MQYEKDKISPAVVKRLPMYYRYLSELLDLGVKKVSSKELSEIMNLTASQIRQDLNNFGSFGMQGFGYDVEILMDAIVSILGIKKTKTMVILGAGNLGQALSKFPFESTGIKVTALFDRKKELIGKKITEDIEIKSVAKIETYIEENPTDIIAITISGNKGSGISKIISRMPIKGIWNFTNVELDIPKEIEVVNVHLVDSLMQLAYKIK